MAVSSDLNNEIRSVELVEIIRYSFSLSSSFCVASFICVISLIVPIKPTITFSLLVTGENLLMTQVVPFPIVWYLNSIEKSERVRIAFCQVSNTFFCLQDELQARVPE